MITREKGIKLLSLFSHLDFHNVHCNFGRRTNWRHKAKENPVIILNYTNDMVKTWLARTETK